MFTTNRCSALASWAALTDSGAMPSWIVTHGGRKYLLYVGWNAGVSVSYRNSIGIAASGDGGKTFSRLYKGPIPRPHPRRTTLLRHLLW